MDSLRTDRSRCPRHCANGLRAKQVVRMNTRLLLRPLWAGLGTRSVGRRLLSNIQTQPTQKSPLGAQSAFVRGLSPVHGPPAFCPLLSVEDFVGAFVLFGFSERFVVAAPVCQAYRA